MATQSEKPVKTRSNNFRKLNSMLSMWYGVIVGSLQVYIIVQNVWKFVRFAELPWPYQQTPTMELNIFIGLNGLAVLLLPFFITACFLKVGNLANDNQMLGKRLKCTDDWSSLLTENKITKQNGQDSGSTLFSIWTHCGPISSLLHIICSICLLFPQMMMEGILIKHGFLAKENVWKSDLDFLKNDEPEDMVVRPIGGDNGASDFAKRVFPLTSRHDGLKLEFINYAIALFIFSIRYAQVFWSSHKKFAVILGLQQILNNIHTLVSFCTLTVLYKVHIANVYQKSTPFLLNSQITMLIFTISLTVLFLSSPVLYYLGYLKFASFLQEKIRKQYVTCSADTSFNGNGWAYFPHSAAVSIALALAATQSPLVHDAFIVYQISSRNFLLAFPISSMIHFLLWALLWLCLTLTKNWTFHINATFVQPVDGLQGAGLSAEITIDLTDNISNGPFSPPLLVISEGKAFSVNNSQDQKSILALIPQIEDSVDPSYWKKSSTPTPSCLSYKQKDHSKIKYMPCRKEVTFDDELQSPRYYSRAPSRADKPELKQGPSENYCTNPHHEDFDSGEYAYLSGAKNCHLLKQTQVPRVVRENEPLYGQLCMKMNFMERNTVSSPISTVESSSGVSSISNKSNFGPPSTSASCSQFSEGLMSFGECEKSDSLVEPSAHYEPVPVRMLSRRNSVRSYGPQESSDSACENHHSSQDQRILSESIYGKLREGITPISRSESIYSSSRSNKLIYESRFNRSIYEKSPREADSRCNYSNSNPKFCYDSSSSSQQEPSQNVSSCNNLENNSKIYGYIDDIIPPIPPPLPILTCVVRKGNCAIPTHQSSHVN